MYFQTVYSLLISITFASSQHCGISGKVVSLIINGTQTQRGTWPWLASLHDFRTNKFLCGGTLISADSVLTAAHCIQNKYHSTARSPIDIIIKLGRYDLSQFYELGGVDANALEIFIHPNWKIASRDYDSDIAIIKLSSAITFSDTILPICMWQSNEPPSVDYGYVVGYGKSENDAIHENIPRQLDIKIVPSTECYLKNPVLAYISSVNTFCAGKDEHSAPCEGDSGTGMYLKDGDRWYLRGIVSASHFTSNGKCDTTADTIFTNVLSFTNWINEKVPNLKEHPKQVSSNNSITHRKEIVCYVASWAIYRKEGDAFGIDNLKPELCTTIIYHFSGLDDDSKLKSLDPWRDLGDNGGLNGYKQFTTLKKSYPHLKLLLSVGGWNEGVQKYSDLAASSTKRKAFAIQSAEFLKKFDFDGLNFFWDYPGDSERGGIPADKENFPLLLKDIYEVYNQQKLYLSVTLRANEWRVSLAYNLEEIVKYVDAINVMTFDYAGAWDKRIGFPAALMTKASDNSIETAMKLFMMSKVPKNKIILGIPFYARTFKTSFDGNIGDECEREGFAGPILESNVLVGFNELCKMKSQKSWVYRYHKDASQMIGKFIENGKINVAVYDSPRAVANKVKYMIENDFLGVWAWSIDTDDFRGICSIDEDIYDDFQGYHKPQLPKERDFPLLRTMNNVIKFMENRN